MNSVDILKKIKELSNLKLVASNVTMNDGKTVEVSVTKLQTDVNNLQGEVTNLKSEVGASRQSMIMNVNKSMNIL